MPLTSPPVSIQKVRVAIIGAGNAANAHAKRLQAQAHCELVAVVDVRPEAVEAFRVKNAVPAGFVDVAEMLRSTPCDAVVVATPDGFHSPVSIQCLRAGKHVLCEKPLALNSGDARKMVRAAQAARRVNMVNFSYRNWPATHALAELVRGGALGEIRHVEASYYQSWLASKLWGDWRTSPNWLWRLSKNHGSGGVLGDVGVHILDFAMFPVGAISRVYCQLATFDKAPGNRIQDYVLDANDTAIVNATFASGAVGVIHMTRWASGHANRLHLKIFGTLGAAEIDSDRSTTAVRICDGDFLDQAKWRDLQAPPVASITEQFLAAIRGAPAYEPDFVQGTQVQQVLDACFKSDARGRPVSIAQRSATL
jgi:predicted dehydrogenase